MRSEGLQVRSALLVEGGQREREHAVPAAVDEADGHGRLVLCEDMMFFYVNNVRV